MKPERPDTMYTFERKQKIPKPLSEVWDFFSDPKNLNEMTPSSLKFEILTKNLGSLHEGQIIDYRIEVLPGIKREWRTEIISVIEKSEFVDEQALGPYRYWHHRHTFEEAEDGVWVGDKVSFNLRYGILGKLIYHVIVRKQLVEIFEFRSNFLVERFNASPAVSSGCL
jgi:ligand-binding SRPBCC domain-containing protein